MAFKIRAVHHGLKGTLCGAPPTNLAWFLEEFDRAQHLFAEANRVHRREVARCGSRTGVSFHAIAVNIVRGWLLDDECGLERITPGCDLSELRAAMSMELATVEAMTPATPKTRTTDNNTAVTLDTFKQGTPPQKAAALYIEAAQAGNAGTQKHFLADFNIGKRDKVKLQTFKNAVSDIRQKLKIDGRKKGSIAR